MLCFGACVCEETAKKSQTEKSWKQELNEKKNLLAFEILGDTANRHDDGVFCILCFISKWLFSLGCGYVWGRYYSLFGWCNVAVRSFNVNCVIQACNKSVIVSTSWKTNQGLFRIKYVCTIKGWLILPINLLNRR